MRRLLLAVVVITGCSFYNTHDPALIDQWEAPEIPQSIIFWADGSMLMMRQRDPPFLSGAWSTWHGMLTLEWQGYSSTDYTYSIDADTLTIGTQRYTRLVVTP